MATSPHELVLGLPRRVAIGGEDWYGIRHQELDDLLGLIDRFGAYRPRAEAEEDATWKQVIPYLLLRDGDRIFLMCRTRAGGDERLHERWSIGVGGHLNPEDGDLLGGLQREFREELRADWTPEPRLLGLLNDDTTPVGQVHLGVVFSAEAAGRAVSIRETHKLSGAFVDVATIWAGYEHLESWSQIVFDHVRAGHGHERGDHARG
jgi:predicted NUDIX family phosphoesterase